MTTYIQLSCSDNKVNIHKDTSISPNLTINGDLDSSTKFPLDIKSSAVHTECWTLAAFHQGVANSGSWLQFSRNGTSTTWQAGMSSDNSYVIRASDATNLLTVSQNGNTSINGDLNATGRILIDGSHLNVQPKSSTSSETLVLDQSMSSEFGSDSHGINVYGRQGGNSHLKVLQQ